MTPEETKREIEKLKKDIKELQDYVVMKKRQQITLPLDEPSKRILGI